MDFRVEKLEDVDRTHVSADKDIWLVLVKATVNLQIP